MRMRQDCPWIMVVGVSEGYYIFLSILTNVKNSSHKLPKSDSDALALSVALNIHCCMVLLWM